MRNYCEAQNISEMIQSFNILYIFVNVLQELLWSDLLQKICLQVFG